MPAANAKTSSAFSSALSQRRFASSSRHKTSLDNQHSFWNPALIAVQLLVNQLIFYFSVSCILILSSRLLNILQCFLHKNSGCSAAISLGFVVGTEAFKGGSAFFHYKLLAAVAVVGGYVMLGFASGYVVGRSKPLLDFFVSSFVIAWLVAVFFEGSVFAMGAAWYISHVCGAYCGLLLGRRICVEIELEPIDLSSFSNVGNALHNTNVPVIILSDQIVSNWILAFVGPIRYGFARLRWTLAVCRLVLLGRSSLQKLS